MILNKRELLFPQVSKQNIKIMEKTINAFNSTPIFTLESGDTISIKNNQVIFHSFNLSEEKKIVLLAFFWGYVAGVKEVL